MDRRREVLRLTSCWAVVLIFVGLGARVASAESITTSVKVDPDQRNFILRYWNDNHVGPGNIPDRSAVEAHLTARIAQQLSQVLRMYDFKPTRGPATLEITVVGAGAAFWPTNELRFVMRKRNGIAVPAPGSDDDRASFLLAQCPADQDCSCPRDLDPRTPCRWDLSRDEWIRRAIVGAVRSWTTIGPTLRSLPVAHSIKVADKRAKVAVGFEELGIDIDNGAFAVFEARASGPRSHGQAWFLLCDGTVDDAHGPFIPQASSDAATADTCRLPSATVPTRTDWPEFYLLRYKP